MTFASNLAGLNAALAGLAFLPSPNVNGSGAQLAVQVTHLGQTGSRTIPISVTAANDAPVVAGPASRTIPISATPVNDAPVPTAPAAIAVVGDIATPPTGGFVVADVDAANLQLTRSVPAGTLTAAASASVDIVGNGTGTLVLGGNVAALNAYLGAAALTYLTAPDANGTVTLTMTLDDRGNSGSGGAQSDTKNAALNIEARPDADLAVTLANARTFVAGGSAAHCRFVVRNNGTDSIADDILDFSTSGNMSNIAWACTPAAPAACPAPAGSGAPVFSGFTLPAGDTAGSVARRSHGGADRRRRDVPGRVPVNPRGQRDPVRTP